MACTCGHTVEEHIGDVEVSRSTECNAGLCKCVAYEEDVDEDEDEEETEDEDE